MPALMPLAQLALKLGCALPTPSVFTIEPELLPPCWEVYCYPFVQDRMFRNLWSLQLFSSNCGMQTLWLYVLTWKESERKFFIFFCPDMIVAYISLTLFLQSIQHQFFCYILSPFDLSDDWSFGLNLFATFIKTSFSY